MSRKEEKVKVQAQLSDDFPVRKEGVPVLEISDLCVSFPSEDGIVRAVRGVNFSVESGEVIGIVGESGSGKSVTSMAVMGLLDDYAQVSGSIKINGVEMLGRDDNYMSNVRGKVISMVFQDPLSALTPVYTVGDQLVEALLVHNEMSKEEAKTRAIEILGKVGIPNPDIRFRSFPHEFSGGMRQRVMIAMAIANDPDLIIADEPTTALDVTIQAQILDLLRYAQQETGAAVVMITHDLGVVAGLANKVAVMYAGKIVERGMAEDIFYNASMPYTIGLLGASPRPDIKNDDALAPVEGNPPSMLKPVVGCPFAPRCPIATPNCHDGGEPDLLLVPGAQDLGAKSHMVACSYASEIVAKKMTYTDIYSVPKRHMNRIREQRDQREDILRLENLVKHFPLTKGAVFKRRVGTVHAVDGISLDIKSGEVLGLVGESGCGKTTTILEILDLLKPQDGKIVVLGKDTATLSRADRKEIRKDLQVVFQDPMASLDPRMPVFDIIAEPLVYNGYPKSKVEDRVAELMELVGLEPSHRNRYPRHFSGGQRQRIGIARAIALNPKILVLDEPVSALDVSIQAGVINLLDQLKDEIDLSYLFVAHDLSVVRHIADRVAVMYIGKLVEIGDVNVVFDTPRHPYTQALLSAIPIADPKKERTRNRIVLQGDLPSPANPPSGCRFNTRCPMLQKLSDTDKAVCVGTHPELVPVEGIDLQVACHYPEVVSVF